MTPLLLGILLVVIAVITAVVALPWVAVPLFVIGVLMLIWAAIGLFRGGGPVTEVRHARKAELLGPGGPDDPDAGA
ncbi:MAG TPA: hypothetical protein VHC45_03290 [Gaiellaceae bacterium]|jgi:threonine/homoserine/homoserine lactone efflux protein|nr:hypothetical protein [Gaiellaceae bacterium]